MCGCVWRTIGSYVFATLCVGACGVPLAGVLVGNKADLREAGRGAVEEKEARGLAKTLNLAYFETSAVRQCCALTISALTTTTAL